MFFFQFLVQASRKRPHQNRHSDEDELLHYRCRLGILKLTRAELLGDEIVEDDDDLPERLKLWCYPTGQNGAGQFGIPTEFEVRRIDERIWVISSIIRLD